MGCMDSCYLYVNIGDVGGKPVVSFLIQCHLVIVEVTMAGFNVIWQPRTSFHCELLTVHL